MFKRSRRNKYGAKKTVIDNIVFHSKLEGGHYKFLKQCEMRGLIYNLQLQVPIDVRLMNNETGLFVKYFTYICDFVFWDNHLNKWRHVDSKGVETDIFKMKMKGVLLQKGIKLELWKSTKPTLEYVEN